MTDPRDRLRTLTCRTGKFLLREAGRVLCARPGFIDSDALVYPRRYDIVMREKFVGFYRSRRALYVDDRARFLELAREQPYHRFFRGIPSASADLRLRFPAESEDELFARKIASFVELVESMERDGFDCSRRIQLKCPVGGAATRGCSIGDGCHRLSVLRHTHGHALDGAYFVVTPRLASRQRNNTATLLAKGLLTAAEKREIEKAGDGRGSCSSLDGSNRLQSEATLCRKRLRRTP